MEFFLDMLFSFCFIVSTRCPQQMSANLQSQIPVSSFFPWEEIETILLAAFVNEHVLPRTLDLMTLDPADLLLVIGQLFGEENTAGAFW